MPELADMLPWLLLIGAVWLAIWVWALRTIFTSPKFLRKGLWVLLTFFTFTFQWGFENGVSIGVGVPLGALYVLWFARYGRAPTDEERARHAARITSKEITAGQLLVLRIAYGAFAAAFVVIGAWAIIGPFGIAFSREAASAGAPPEFEAMFLSMMVGMFALFAGVFVLLILRPYWWGKLLCALCAVAWIGNAAMSAFLLPQVFGEAFPAAQHLAVVGGAGLVALACGIVHQVIDPRFGGSYPRAAGQTVAHP